LPGANPDMASISLSRTDAVGRAGRREYDARVSVVRAALVTPLTGPLARFGRATAAALTVWAEQAADLSPAFVGVRLDTYDSHPDPSRAMRVATESGPDVVFGPYGTGPALAALKATDRVVWNHGGATSRLAWRNFPSVINVLSPASTYLVGVVDAVRAVDPLARRMSMSRRRGACGLWARLYTCAYT
jgi:branched-chain amino acid transport system substrate-binding protein